MKLAIMQPYLFPYLGYFQLIHAADAFVLYDDVNYIKGGWINRNYILGQGEKQWVTLSTEGASPNNRINQVSRGSNSKKLLKTIRQNYSMAPNFAAVFPVIEEILRQPERNLARFLDMGLKKICAYFGLRRAWYVSSNLEKDNSLRGEEKVLAICEELSATHYINLPGGKALYDEISFIKRGIQLLFVEPKPIEYRQFDRVFVPDLSILDVMMFNDKAQCGRLLREYELV